MMADIEYIKERQDRENYRFDITELGGSMPKLDRIRRMIPIFESGRFHLPETLRKVDYEGVTHDLVQDFIEEEYKAFPVAIHDDVFDAISRIQDAELNIIWPRPSVPLDRYARGKIKKRNYSSMAA